jgi:hypothetical protein
MPVKAGTHLAAGYISEIIRLWQQFFRRFIDRFLLYNL